MRARKWQEVRKLFQNNVGLSFSTQDLRLISSLRKHFQMKDTGVAIRSTAKHAAEVAKAHSQVHAASAMREGD